MKISDFHYQVPAELIATEALASRSSARLLFYDRASDLINHSTFQNLAQHLPEGSVVVVNNSSVIPARFYGRKKTGGKLEGLFLKRMPEGVSAWIKGKVETGEAFEVEGFGELTVMLRDGKEVRLKCDASRFLNFLKAHGEIPVPPYIVAEREKRGAAHLFSKDSKDYQSIFSQAAKAKENFSVAAPTASLHFDESLLQSLKEKNISIEEITLHVGAGTFAPLEKENVDEHRLHHESVSIDRNVWNRLRQAKKEGRKIVAVGTTAMRSLESAALRSDENFTEDFSTDLFIRPPFRFKMVDALITNFHWPESSLLILVATFLEAQNSGCQAEIRHLWRKIYDEGIAHRYRLFSYGDGMLIL